MRVERIQWRRTALVSATLVIWVGLLGFSIPAMAQEEEELTPEQQAAMDEALDRPFEEEITVTGTLIPRPDVEGLSPVAVMGVEEVTFSGLTRIEDLVNNLPQAYARQTSVKANGASGTATVDLRYLGSNRTLVLLNGKRLPPGDPRGTYAPDLNNIPVSLIKRIDVLTGGASAVYGSDAIAGVVNFIIDQEFEGLRGGITYSGNWHNNDNAFAQQMNLDAGYDPPTGSTFDGQGINLDLAFGGKFADGKGHASAYIAYRKLDELTKDARDYTNCSPWATEDGAICGGSSTTPAARFRPRYSPNHPDPDLAGQQIGDFIVAANSDQFRPRNATTDLYNYGPWNHFQRPDERWNAGAFINYRFNDMFEGYMELQFMDDVTLAQIAPTGNFNVAPNVNCDNPMLSEQQYDIICVQGGYSDDEYATVSINRRSLEGGPRDWEHRHSNYRLVAGLRGDLSDEWSYDLYGMHAQMDFLEIGGNDANITRMQNALDIIEDENGNWVCRSGDAGCVPWNIFVDNGNQIVDDYRLGVTQEAIDYMYTRYLDSGGSQIQLGNLTFTGDLEGYGWTLPSATEGVQVAAGGEVRREYLWRQPDEVNVQGSAGSGGGAERIDAAYTVYEAFVETLIPFVQDASLAYDLSAELGYRYSDYSTSGGANTWKTLLSWAPTQSFRFRVSYNRAIRSANIYELYRPSGFDLGGTFDPCSGPTPTATFEQCAATGVTQSQYGRIDPNPANQYNTLEGGNADLNPEVADTFTVGVVVTPSGLPGFTATLDYYDISIEDAIDPLAYGTVMNQCINTGDPAYCDLIVRDEFGSLWNTQRGYVITTYQNVGLYGNRGVDLTLNYMHTIGNAGLISFDFAGTYLMENSFAQAEISYDCAGYFGLANCIDPLPEWAHLFRFSWETNFGSTFSLGWRYLTKVWNETAAEDQPDLYRPEQQEIWEASDIGWIDAYNYLDLGWTHTLNESIQFTLGVNNVLDKDPPIGADHADDPNVTFYNAYDPLGRYVHASLRFAF
jgi:outer membrane receptor protein involved in Fe transport